MNVVKHTVAVLSGDGIGPEVMNVTLNILDQVCNANNIQFDYKEALVGGVAIDQMGVALPKETLSICEKSDAILFGSVGGPKWESLPPEQQPERGALLPLRSHFQLYANFRPAIIYPELKLASPLRADLIQNKLDILVLRELTGGIYFGKPKGREKTENSEKAFDTLVYHTYEIERIAILAFGIAMQRTKKVHSIDKANVLSSMVLWRETVTKIHKQFPEVDLHHMYVDNAAMQLIRQPSQFDVILCPNMFGDILSDIASQITGSIGMLPSASLGAKNNDCYFGLYEPAGGSAPDIAGHNMANPIAQILSACMMLRYSFNLNKEAEKIEKAIERAIKSGARTKDIATQEPNKSLTTTEMSEAILSFL